MIRIALVEDDPAYAEQLLSYLKEYEKESKERISVQTFSDGEDIVTEYRADYDIILMDVEMKFMDGMSAAEEIRKMDTEVVIIFITNMPQYAIQGYRVDALDYELVDIFNWQEEAAGMISQMEFVRRVDVQAETIERYAREGLLVPDLVVPMSEHRTFKYFREETLRKYAEQYGWTLIDDSNRKDLFLEMVRQMDMSYSYKPVLLKAVLLYADDKGRVKLSDIAAYFREFYEARRTAGLTVEKSNSLYAKGGYTDAQAQRNILSNPFKRFEDMQMLHHTRTLGVIQVDESVWKKLTPEEKQEIEQICNEKLEQYYRRLEKHSLRE